MYGHSARARRPSSEDLRIQIDASILVHTAPGAGRTSFQFGVGSFQVILDLRPSIKSVFTRKP